MTTEVKPQHFSARFSTQHIAVLVKLSHDSVVWHHAFDGIQIEPHPEGGVTIMATNGCMMAWVHDKTGTASGPIVLDACEKFMAACEAPEIKRPFDCNGEAWDIPLPDWMTPHRITVIGDNDGMVHTRHQIAPRAKGFDMILIMAKGLPADIETTGDGPTLFKSSGREPGDTQTICRKIIDWKAIVPKGEPAPVGQFKLDTEYLTLLNRFGRLARMTFHGEHRAVAVEFDDAPDCHVLIMPIKAALAAADGSAPPAAGDGEGGGR